MFGRKRRAAIEQRTKLLGRVVMLITDGLCTKSYDQFVESFSNPGEEPDAVARDARTARFELRISTTCWYEATASFADETQPSLYIQGGGDDCGVLISLHVSADANVPVYPVVDLHVPKGSKRGRDARKVVRALQAMRGWKCVTPI
jgi:hypothetical protein